MSDVWELVYSVGGLAAGDDTDGDGFSNGIEAAAATDPRDRWSFPSIGIAHEPSSSVLLSWPSKAGKRYRLLGSSDLGGGWVPESDRVAAADGLLGDERPAAGRRFFRLEFGDVDTDGDGVNDWEERAVRFDPSRSRTGRSDQADLARVTAGLTAANTITVSVYDPECAERWPDPAVIVVRRTGGIQPLVVNVSLGGSATREIDYVLNITGNAVAFAPGQREVFVEVLAVAETTDTEPDEDVVLSVLPGAGYSLGSAPSAGVMIRNQPAGGLPSAKEAARFLIQAAFGPDQDSADDPDQIPENVEEVMQMGFAAWIDEQASRPVGVLRPFVLWASSQPPSAEIYNDVKQDAWWGRAMGLPKLRPDATTTQLPDPLRQRVAFALSQIFVISDRMEDLAVNPEGMVHFYDMLLEHALGNYRDLLLGVSRHPCMGMYLSHLGNRKPDLVNRIYPDENYAREVMQLFSIGLWELNPDGTRKLDAEGQPIPTYSNRDITEFARVFTGLAFGGPDSVNFGLWPRSFVHPMAAWDAEHDCDPKTLLRGATTPVRTPSAGRTGTATTADLNAAIDNLFNHPNTGPFVSRLLIQRFVTSNPTPTFVGRVAAAFADNGQGVRGDMKSVVRAILLDPEARDGARLTDPVFGKMREPFLRCVNVARAFNASSPEGWFYLDAFVLDHAQEPLNSPSVFNFFLPTYAPPGPLAQAGLVAPEFQIINATSGVTAPNYFWNTITNGLHRWGTGRPLRETRLSLDQEMLMNVPAAAIGDPSPNIQPLDPDPLIRRLDLVLTGGRLRPETCQTIREALVRIGPFSTWEWPKERLKLAIHLVITSPEFAVQR